MTYTYKKYQNRKYYCPEEKAFVGLADIGTNILNGIDPVVICHKTKRDITAQTLEQVINMRRKRFPAEVATLLAEIRACR